MKLQKKSIEWSFTSLKKYRDSDLFPFPIELDILLKDECEYIDKISNFEIENIGIGSSRRFIIPKDDMSYRTATQLDPLNSIIFNAVAYEFGYNIEKRRIPKEDNIVISYRFNPDDDGALYDNEYNWNFFWNICQKKSSDFEYAIVLDISDFYNQIYHHTIENQLIESSFPNQVKKWIENLFKSLTAKVSRGVPVGPHATHIFAEMAMIPIDNSLISRGYTFCRFVDDIIIFCNDKTEARSILYTMADILDKQQRLQLQRQKTKVLEKEAFMDYCKNMIEDRPINSTEEIILGTIRKYSSDDPYRVIFLSSISSDELKDFSEENIEIIFNEYLSNDEPDYIRLRWFIRRLAQVGYPSALKYILENFDKLVPALGDIIRYISSIENGKIDWKYIGDQILLLLDLDITKSNDYFLYSLYSLFSTKVEINHLHSLIKKYKESAAIVQREIIIASYKNKAADWLRELKEIFPTMDEWNKRAYIIAISILPIEERKFFLRDVSTKDNILFDFLKTFCLT